MLEPSWLPFSIQTWLLIAVITVAIWRTARSDRGAGPQQRTVDPQRRAVLRLGAALSLGFVALGGRLLQITITDADKIHDRTGRDDEGNVLSNPRTLAEMIQRGERFAPPSPAAAPSNGVTASR